MLYKTRERYMQGRGNPPTSSLSLSIVYPLYYTHLLKEADALVSGHTNCITNLCCKKPIPNGIKDTHRRLPQKTYPYDDL